MDIREAVSPILISGGTIVLEKRLVDGGSLLIDGGLIQRVLEPGDSAPPGDFRRIDARGAYIGPGLVELHIHGCDDLGFESEEPGALAKIGAFLLRNGVTTYLPTLQCSLPALRRLAAALRAAPATAARVPGFYVEGPFVNPARRGGIMTETLKAPDPALLRGVLDAAGGYLRLMTVAPELPGSGEIIRLLLEAGVVPCLGHSDCSIDELPAARERLSVTHLFNAMAPISHKRAGLAMLPFLDPSVFFELNGDGVHVNSESLKMCYDHLNHDRLMLISDAVVSAGREGGQYDYFGRTVLSGEDGVRYEDGTLIGSRCLMPSVVKRFIAATGASVAEGFRFASLNPCRLLGLAGRRGSIAEGKEADLVLLDRESLDVRTVLAAGREVGVRKEGG
jgi:N-acetylglucosamine-6-phosphate deacetylase